jgi:hypothetical protein
MKKAVGKTEIGVLQHPASVACRLACKLPKAPERLRNTHASRISASHNQADGNRRNTRRSQKLRVCCQHS